MKLTPSLHPFGQECREIGYFPNATIDEYGVYRLSDGDVVTRVKAEIYTRGPVAAAVNGKALHEYKGGVFDDDEASQETTHIVSLIGWNMTESGGEYWIGRNSWGEYWGEMGFFRIAMGKNMLGIEEHVTWATPGVYTAQNFPCFEDGKNCAPQSSVMLNG